MQTTPMESPKPTALVITAAGINCDVELAYAFDVAGATTTSLHLNELMHDPSIIDAFDLIGMPGGFSFGDAIAAGRVMALHMRESLYPAIVAAIERGVPIFAPCNGFQIAAQVGLLPGPLDVDDWPAEPPAPTIALSQNKDGEFVNRWTRVELPPSKCIWTQNLQATEATLRLPSAHGEGRLMVADPSIIASLEANEQVALRYHPNDNFNGSTNAIAGICDRSGLVFGLMPHPERFTRWVQHPFWTRLSEDDQQHEPIGLQMFRNAVQFVNEKKSSPKLTAATAQSPNHSIATSPNVSPADR